MNRKIKKALKANFNSPQSKRKKEFLNSLPYPKATTTEFVLSQLGYIRKGFWFLSVLILCLMIMASMMFTKKVEIVGILSSVLPFLTFIAITEINKSLAFNMGELEASCKLGFSKIVLVRLVIISIFHFIILLIMLLVFKEQSQYGVIRYGLYIVTPFLLSSYLSFWVANHLKTADAGYVCGGVSAFISISIMIININYNIAYKDTYTFLWAIVFLAAAILLAKEIYFFTNERTVQWNFI